MASQNQLGPNRGCVKLTEMCQYHVGMILCNHKIKQSRREHTHITNRVAKNILLRGNLTSVANFSPEIA